MVGCSARAIAIYSFVQAVDMLGNLAELQVYSKFKCAASDHLCYGSRAGSLELRSNLTPSLSPQFNLNLKKFLA